MILDSLAYKKIKIFYSDRFAKRSKVPLINHIDEGLLILDYLGADSLVKDAFCLHPLFQDSEELVNTINDSDYNLIDVKSIILAMEYRHVANSFLSGKKKENMLPLINEDVAVMLVADKVQNYKDFLTYHKDTHKNSKRLDAYFNEWFDVLNIDYNEIVSKVF